jgi:hypothetical protein
MDRVRNRVKDKRVLLLVKAFLKGSCWVVSGVGGQYAGNNCGSPADTASRPQL